MFFGVIEKEQEIITQILNEYKSYSFYFYGSRVKGTFEKTSDLDILIKGENEMPISILAELREKTDNSKLPYIVNFCDFHSLNADFYQLIKDDLILIK